MARAKTAASSLVLQVLSIALVAVCWGSYGPTLHKGQAAMMNSRLRPLLCVGLAYFVIAVILPPFVLMNAPEASRFSHLSGTFWSMMAGAAGALGALGIIMAFNFGGKPFFVMPVVFGGAPVVNALFTMYMHPPKVTPNPLLWVGMVMVSVGAALVLYFKPQA
jgi:hypothetical protein